MVALSGAHTLGAANCKSFIYRTSGTGGDPNMDPKFKAELQRVCGGGLLNGNDTQIISGSFEKGTFPLDPTPSYFDNAYYQSLLNHTGLLASDQLLVSSTEADLVATTKVLVDKYSENKTIFQIDFGASMVKMSTIGVLTGKDGQVRQNCRMPNSQKFERRGF
ncbi:peroxidase 58-like [Malania oleifera]|uniref:peroxidase 58-like n=1 Tax=Malania oleifera TaxID=397392 RepID=UPI0025AEB700|nr:peroxidase 58-like [Malania oleifera]